MKNQNYDIPQLDLDNITPQMDFSSTINQANMAAAEMRILESVAQEREQRYNDGVNRENRMIELLESIDKNTSVLSNIVELLEMSTNNQKEILEIINDFNLLPTIADKNDKQSLYRKTMNKINTLISDVDTINTLCAYGMTIYNMVKDKL